MPNSTNPWEHLEVIALFDIHHKNDFVGGFISLKLELTQYEKPVTTYE